MTKSVLGELCVKLSSIMGRAAIALRINGTQGSSCRCTIDKDEDGDDCPVAYATAQHGTDHYKVSLRIIHGLNVILGELERCSLTEYELLRSEEWVAETGIVNTAKRLVSVLVADCLKSMDMNRSLRVLLEQEETK